MLNKINRKPQSYAKVCDENEENKEKKQLAVIFLNKKDRF